MTRLAAAYSGLGWSWRIVDRGTTAHLLPRIVFPRGARAACGRPVRPSAAIEEPVLGLFGEIAYCRSCRRADGEAAA